MRRNYVAEARRSGRWWAIEVPEVRGAFSQARRLADVEPMARDAIAGVLDVPIGNVRVEVRPVLDERLANVVQAAREARVAALETQLDAARLSSDALRALERAEIPLRDAGELLGMSHQRAAQIANTDRRAADRHRRKAIAELRASYDVVSDPRPSAGRRKR
jgi:predicted RNase H-like HicB family nuclease